MSRYGHPVRGSDLLNCPETQLRHPAGLQDTLKVSSYDEGIGCGFDNLSPDGAFPDGRQGPRVGRRQEPDGWRQSAGETLPLRVTPARCLSGYLGASARSEGLEPPTF